MMTKRRMMKFVQARVAGLFSDKAEPDPITAQFTGAQVLNWIEGDIIATLREHLLGGYSGTLIPTYLWHPRVQATPP